MCPTGLYKAFWYTGYAFTKYFNHNNNHNHNDTPVAISTHCIVVTLIGIYTVNQARPQPDSLRPAADVCLAMVKKNKLNMQKLDRT